MLQAGKDRAAVGQAFVRNAGELNLSAGSEAPDVEGFDGRVGEVETAVEESV